MVLQITQSCEFHIYIIFILGGGGGGGGGGFEVRLDALNFIKDRQSILLPVICKEVGPQGFR